MSLGNFSGRDDWKKSGLWKAVGLQEEKDEGSSGAWGNLTLVLMPADDRIQDTSFRLPHFPVASPSLHNPSHFKAQRRLPPASSSHWKAVSSHPPQRKHSPDSGQGRAGTAKSKQAGCCQLTDVTAHISHTPPSPQQDLAKQAARSHTAVYFGSDWKLSLPIATGIGEKSFHRFQLMSMSKNWFISKPLFFLGCSEEGWGSLYCYCCLCRAIWMLVVLVWQF